MLRFTFLPWLLKFLFFLLIFPPSPFVSSSLTPTTVLRLRLHFPTRSPSLRPVLCFLPSRWVWTVSSPADSHDVHRPDAAGRHHGAEVPLKLPRHPRRSQHPAGPDVTRHRHGHRQPSVCCEQVARPDRWERSPSVSGLFSISYSEEVEESVCGDQSPSRPPQLPLSSTTWSLINQTIDPSCPVSDGHWFGRQLTLSLG